MSSPTFELNNIIVRAGAGAGKTTRLTQTVLDVAQGFKKKHARWPRVVVTTFTRKATQELRERLVTVTCRDQSQELLQYVSSPSQVFISTIHGVLNLFLKQYSHLANLNAGYTLLSEAEAQNMARQVLRDVVWGQFAGKDLLELFSFDDLLKLCRHYGQAKLENPELGFQDELSLQQLWERELSEWADRLKSACAKLRAETEDEKFRDYAEALSGLATEVLTSQSEKFDLHKEQILARWPKRPSVRGKNPSLSEGFKGWLDNELKRLKTLLEKEALSPQYWQPLQSVYAQFAEVASGFHEQFQKKKQVQGVIEMGDLELLTLDILRRYPELGQAFAADWDYWLVDEYQDTSPVQVEILRSLIGLQSSFTVGDPQQSIYLFRGARSEVFVEKEQEICGQGGRAELQMKNYRSRPELLMFFNDFFKTLNPDFFQSMEPRDEIKDLSAPLVATFYGSVDKENPQENQAIVYHVLSLLDNPSVRLDDICILARKHRSLVDVSQALRQSAIPAHVHAASGFYRRREVQDALMLLNFIVNPHDNFNLIGLLRSPWCRIDDTLLVEWMKDSPVSLWQHICGLSMIEQLRIYQESKHRMGVSEVWVEALVNLGFFDMSRQYDPSGRRESNLWKLVTKLKNDERRPGFNYLSFTDQNSRQDLDESVSEEGDAVAALEPDNINLMTIHASKGLQFKHIIVVRGHEPSPTTDIASFTVHKGRWSFPVPLGEDGARVNSIAEIQYLREMQQRELEESDRLLYVALTRAKETVALTWSEPIQKNSWLSRFQCMEGEVGGSWLQGQAGVIRRKFYSYEINYGPWEAGVYQRGLKSSLLETRPRYEPKDDTKYFIKKSVTSLLAEQGEGKDLSLGGGMMPFSLGVGKNPRPKDEVEKDASMSQALRKSSEGVLIHRLMEVLHDQPDFDFEQVIESWFGERAGEVRKGIQYVRELQEPPIMELLKHGHVEWGFQWLYQQASILEGQIDLWAIVNGHLWVVDYKSGSQKYIEKAFQQLNIYAQALRAFGYTQPCSLAVIFPLEQTTVIRSANDHFWTFLG